MAAATLATRTLPLNADVAEWCAAPAHADILAAGTYQLDEAAGMRQGRVHLYRLSCLEGWSGGGGDGGGSDSSSGGSTQQQQPSLTDLSTLDLPGVFDLRWHPADALLAAALADGSVRLLQLEAHAGSGGGGSPCSTSGGTDSSSMALQEVACVPPLDEEAGGGPAPAANASMAVSLDWGRCCCGGAAESEDAPEAAAPSSGGSSSSGGDTLVVSYSCGRLQLLAAAPTGLRRLAAWRAHDLEAWSAASHRWNDSVLFSGGDDAAFKVWDARAGFARPAWADRRTHGAGVCCVASSPHQEHAVATGSYDEHARLWDLRNASRPLLITDAACGGGVWRLKWHPSDPRLLLAACMHAGFKLLQADASAGTLEIVETYEHQATLAYGADWCRAPALRRRGRSVAATASFYDRLLHVWSPATGPGGEAAQGSGDIAGGSDAS